MAQPTDVETPVSPAAGKPAPAETHSASPPPPARSEGFLKNRPGARIFLIIAVIVLLIGGFFAYEYFQTYESTDDAEVDGHLMPLSARISPASFTVQAPTFKPSLRACATLAESASRWNGNQPSPPAALIAWNSEPP